MEKGWGEIKGPYVGDSFCVTRDCPFVKNDHFSFFFLLLLLVPLNEIFLLPVSLKYLIKKNLCFNGLFSALCLEINHIVFFGMKLDLLFYNLFNYEYLCEIICQPTVFSLMTFCDVWLEFGKRFFLWKVGLWEMLFEIPFLGLKMTLKIKIESGKIYFWFFQIFFTQHKVYRSNLSKNL